MPFKNTKILGLNQYPKPDKPPFIIYANLECLIEKYDGFKTNLESLSTAKVGEHSPSGFSMPAILPFKSIENKYYVYQPRSQRIFSLWEEGENETKF